MLKIEQTIVDGLVGVACKVLDIARGDFFSTCRKSELVAARRIVWWKLQTMGYSLGEIGEATNRNHSTVLHGIAVLQGSLGNPSYRRENAALRTFIKLTKDYD